MLKITRINKIKEYVFEHRTVSLDELMKKYGVSKNTIRRDIQELVEEGELKKVYGGVSVNDSTLLPFSDRKVQYQHEKKKIAKLAASFVEDGDIIFIDSGTTTLEMLEYIKNRHITIVTNNIDFTIEAMPFDGLNIFSTGGMLERKTKSFTSVNSSEIIKKYNINKAFMASTGITIENGVTNSLPLESEIKKTVVKRSSEVFLLADNYKFGKYALTTYCELNEVDYLITDMPPNKGYQDYADENDIIINIAEE